MQRALSAWLDAEEERDRLTREALADADAGLVIDHQAGQAWANGLGTDDPLPVPRSWNCKGPAHRSQIWHDCLRF